MAKSDEAGKILALLPEALPEDALDALRRLAAEDLGGGAFLVYGRESWANAYDTDTGWPGLDEDRPRPHWAAACRCGACGNAWHSGWQDGAILLAAGPDGVTYPGLPEDEFVVVDEGDKAVCPYCGRRVTAARASSLRHGRTYQVLTVRVENLARYTAAVYWLLRRRVSASGGSEYAALPWAAAVVGSDGRIYRFTHTSSCGFGRHQLTDAWRESPRMGDPLRSRYYNWSCARQAAMGGYIITDVPDQAGRTGEKTGLADYVAGGGEFLMLYLLRQRRFRSLENLVRAGWVFTVDSALYDEAEGRARSGEALGRIADFSKGRPRDMLRMNRAQVARFGSAHWKADRAALWMESGFADPEEFDALAARYGVQALGSVLRMGGVAFARRLDTYLRGQQRRGAIQQLREGATLYLDYRRMLANAGGGDTQPELWPPHLRRAHDRLARLARENTDKRLDPAFAALRDKWRGLEWSDGAICAVLPGESADLVREGRVLQHCVGGYCSQHCRGDLIIFIRHARRPERSWFTLNVDTRGAEWQEIQLHGYGNEYAHGKPLHIPAAVRAFVDRWEREILTPVFRRVKRDEARRQRSEAGA